MVANRSVATTFEVSWGFNIGDASLVISTGDAVRWVLNQGSAKHTVTSVDGLFDSALLSSGSTFDFVFDSVGSYSYFCTPHATDMTGVITVVEGRFELE